MNYQHRYAGSVQPDWVDYNGHMNVAYYTMAFDHALDALLETLGLGVTYRKEQDKSLFVVESHITYKQEMSLNESFEIQTSLIGVDAKRLHTMHRMYKNKDQNLSAVQETMCIHIDFLTRRSCNFDNKINSLIKKKLISMESVDWASDCGRKIKTIS